MCPEVNRHIPPPSDVIQTKPFPVRGKFHINFLIHVYGINLILNISSKYIVRSFPSNKKFNRSYDSDFEIDNVNEYVIFQIIVNNFCE